MSNLILILIVLCMTVIAGIFAGAEIGIYQISTIRLRLNVERKKILSIILLKTLKDRHGLLISITLSTNLLHYVITSAVTILLLKKFASPHSAEAATTLIMAPALFVFAELIPKNIFYYRGDALLGSVSPILFTAHKIFEYTGLVLIFKSISNLIMKLSSNKKITAEAITRKSFLQNIFYESHEEGFLSSTQTDLLKRASSLTYLTINSVMTPLSDVIMIDRNTDRAGLLKILKQTKHTRICVYKDTATDITGFINIYESLRNEDDFSDLDAFIKPIRKMDSDTLVAKAIDIMQTEGLKIAMVRGNANRPVGIITMKDLAEEILGDLAEW